MGLKLHEKSQMTAAAQLMSRLLNDTGHGLVVGEFVNETLQQDWSGTMNLHKPGICTPCHCKYRPA